MSKRRINVCLYSSHRGIGSRRTANWCIPRGHPTASLPGSCCRFSAPSSDCRNLSASDLSFREVKMALMFADDAPVPTEVLRAWYQVINLFLAGTCCMDTIYYALIVKVQYRSLLPGAGSAYIQNRVHSFIRSGMCCCYSSKCSISKKVGKKK